eukprot:SAG31_NODE_1342_length_8700_cov_12.667829_5_plen_82_part_00
MDPVDHDRQHPEVRPYIPVTAPVSQVLGYMFEMYGRTKDTCSVLNLVLLVGPWIRRFRVIFKFSAPDLDTTATLNGETSVV